MSLSSLGRDRAGSVVVKPRILPIVPEGLGTGHACAALCIAATSSADIDRSVSATGFLFGFASPGSAGDAFRFLLTLTCESANCTRGAGHGTICGIATTKKDTASVVPKREEVKRDRGWR